MTTTLVYLSDGPLFQDPAGRLGTYAKSVSGLIEYARHWPGEVVVSSLDRPEPVAASQPGASWADDLHVSNLEFAPQLTLDELAARQPTVVLHSAHGRLSSALVDSPYPTVLTDDWSPHVRLEVGLVSQRGVFDGLRIRAGAVRRQRHIDALARSASGFQCNGHSAFEHYRSVNPATHLFFDHRLRAADIEKARDRPLWDGSSPLRVAYSGRLTRMKGVHHIPPFLERLRSTGLPVEFTYIGTGELAGELRAASPPGTKFAGFVDFEHDWIDLVRKNVDLMFLPHVQGDSASTYFEAMGLGVPVLGFRNRTLTPLLAAGGGGWEVPMGSVPAAVDVVRALFNQPHDLIVQAQQGLDFMADMPFEKIFAGRVQHLRNIAAA